jgi:hypothetical protein
MAISSRKSKSCWSIRTGPDNVRSDLALRTLAEWAEQGRLSADSEVSHNGQDWVRAEAVPELKMEWLVTLNWGEKRGPLNLLAIPNLFREGVLSMDSVLENKVTGRKITASTILKATQGEAAEKSKSKRSPIKSKTGHTILPLKKTTDQPATSQLAASNSGKPVKTPAKPSNVVSARQTLEEALAESEKTKSDLSREVTKLRTEIDLLETKRQGVERTRELKVKKAEAEVDRLKDKCDGLTRSSAEKENELKKEVKDLKSKQRAAADAEELSAPKAELTMLKKENKSRSLSTNSENGKASTSQTAHIQKLQEQLDTSHCEFNEKLKREMAVRDAKEKALKKALEENRQQYQAERNSRLDAHLAQIDAMVESLTYFGVGFGGAGVHPETSSDPDAATEVEAQWYLKLDENEVYGPAQLSDLRVWASQARIGPGHEVSEDQKSWQVVEDVEALRMVWMVTLIDGSRYGPLNILAIRHLINEGVVDGECEVTHVNGGLTGPLDEMIEQDVREIVDTNVENLRQIELFAARERTLRDQLRVFENMLGEREDSASSDSAPSESTSASPQPV